VMKALDERASGAKPGSSLVRSVLQLLPADQGGASMFNRILVPVDFSAPSDAALAYARKLAASFDSTLNLLHILDPAFLRAMVADPRDRDTAMLNRLDERLTDEDRTRFRALTAVEHSDAPADEILRYARLRDIDLIVMGTHGHTGVAHVLLGSVAERVVRSAPCPVLTLRAASDGPTRILATTDFSPPSDRALEYARRVAARCGASLHLLHVLEEMVDTASFGSEVFVPDSPETRVARMNAATERLAHRAGTGPSELPRATTQVVVGSGARTIASYAADNGFDLIVMGTHGRTGLAHLVMGSVAEHVVRTAPCPVLSTHHPREEVRREAEGERTAESATGVNGLPAPETA
jgi:nucleotide-binding universal stress UspA family protein